MSRYFNADGTVRDWAVRGPVGGKQEHSVFGWAGECLPTPETEMKSSIRRITSASNLKLAGIRTKPALEEARPSRPCVFTSRPESCTIILEILPSRAQCWSGAAGEGVCFSRLSLPLCSGRAEITQSSDVYRSPGIFVLRISCNFVDWKRERGSSDRCSCQPLDAKSSPDHVQAVSAENG
jgi:hypothetical protein